MFPAGGKKVIVGCTEAKGCDLAVTVEQAMDGEIGRQHAVYLGQVFGKRVAV